MSNPVHSPVIRLRGVRHNNLKNFALDLPLRRLIVVSGPSGSGKSSLAFDTLFAEGQRRYIETFSPYARQFFDRMDKPQVDAIEGIPPAIAIEQRNSVKTTRSTIGTMTEICDYMKLLWPHVATLHCRQCGQAVRKDTPQSIWNALGGAERRNVSREVLVAFDLPRSGKLSLEESVGLILRQGYQRALVAVPGGCEVVRLEESLALLRESAGDSITIVQDRLALVEPNRPRFAEACEQAYHFGKGKLAIYLIPPRPSTESADTPAPYINSAPSRFSNRAHCARCDIEYRDPSPALFSFNHPVGACPKCHGFGRVISIDYELAVPDKTRTLAQGLVKPWLTGHGLESQEDLLKFCKKRKIRTNVPFHLLPPEVQDWVINGDPDYGTDKARTWPRAWYGVKGYFRWLESKSYKMHVRVLLSRYRAYTPCPDCGGERFQPEALLYTAGGPPGISLAQFYRLNLRDALHFAESVSTPLNLGANNALRLAFEEVQARLGYLVQIGLGYLTLDRPTRTLSGGETERVSLTTCLGSRLVNTLFVLDEPSVGLHPRDTARLVEILHRLRDAGNTVVVVEHEASVMRSADQIVDLGPGHGESGGHLVFQGTPAEILTAENSLTGQYLSGRCVIAIPPRRPVSREGTPWLRLANVELHNLKNLAVEIPLGHLVVITGVSGSGKTTLIREVLLPALDSKLKMRSVPAQGADLEAVPDETAEEREVSAHHGVTLAGAEQIEEVILVDQSSLGRTPRSNPAVYIGAFDDIRELFAQSDEAKRRGFNASSFSFNSLQGQCERCRGAGFEKIEMQFLSDVFIRCAECNGRRYRAHILEVTIASPDQPDSRKSIADMLDATVEDAAAWLRGFGGVKVAQRAAKSLELLESVGLGYLRLGQPINTLSGGESQRLKLVSHLASQTSQGARSLLLFDEPTTGLHFDDVRVLLEVFQQLVDRGNSVVVIEHNLDVIKCADWVIDLGPDAGDEGGKIVAQGTPEEVAGCAASHTGRFLRECLLHTADQSSTASPSIPSK